MYENVLTLDPMGLRAVVALIAPALTAAAVAEIAARVARALIKALSGSEERTEFLGPIVRRPIRVMRAAVFVTVLAALMGPAFEMAGMPYASA